MNGGKGGRGREGRMRRLGIEAGRSLGWTDGGLRGWGLNDLTEREREKSESRGIGCEHSCIKVWVYRLGGSKK